MRVKIEIDRQFRAEWTNVSEWVHGCGSKPDLNRIVDEMPYGDDTEYFICWRKVGDE